MPRDLRPALRQNAGSRPEHTARIVRGDPISLRWLVPAAALATTLIAASAQGGDADVLDGAISALGAERFRIEATVRHGDTGWDHYANRWDVIAPDGTLLGSRELLHPHESEQPFTRSLTLEIPPGIERVTLRAFDSVHEGGGMSVTLDVPR